MIAEAIEKGFSIGFTVLGTGIVAIGIPVALIFLLALVLSGRENSGK